MKDSSRNILVIGGDSAIGSSFLSAECPDKAWRVNGTTRRGERVQNGLGYFDMRTPDARSVLARQDYCTVIFCAGVTSIAHCEMHPLATREINVSDTVSIASGLLSAGKHVIFLSTNMVFDGTRPLVAPDSPTSPSTEYGRQKAESEKLLLAHDGKCTILRLTKVIGDHHPLFESWLERLAKGDAIHPCLNKCMAPVSMCLVINALHQIVQRRHLGIVQVSALHDISYYEAASYLAKSLGYDACLIEPASCNERENGPLPEFTSLLSNIAEELNMGVPSPYLALDFFVHGAKKFTTKAP